MANSAAAKPANPTKVITGKVRFSYAHVWEPTAMEGSDNKKYSVSIIIDKTDTETIDKVKKAIAAAIEAGKTAKFGGKVPANLKTPLRDGDAERSDDEAYKGKFFMSASTKTKPGIVDAKGRPIQDETEFYSGCFGKASLNFFPFNTAGSKGVACGLNNLQKLEDGEALGGRTSAAEDFGVSEDSDDMLS